MSRTTTYGVDQSGNLLTLSEHHNSWRFAPIIWEHLLKKYDLVPEDKFFINFHGEKTCNYTENAHILWETKGFEDKLSDDEFYCLIATYDRAAFHKDCADRLCEAFFAQHKVMTKPDIPTHLEEMAHSIKDNAGFEFYCFDQTSITDTWSIPSSEANYQCECEAEENGEEPDEFYRTPNILFDPCILIYDRETYEISQGAWPR